MKKKNRDFLNLKIYKSRLRIERYRILNKQDARRITKYIIKNKVNCRKY